ncbi:hypothetical protein UA08_02417 [Talaromyces atroroseus]|uniref:Nephrocystin 3-like N-terminal domain-containing protein n=1 Tax=Talaromyces atroroseus TaxID=1441469 RepID=A0A225B989_TALAT|nr:hypothetical protein UA08_02417 [Talaromyces atroroseus]OKL62527.1 hypothetical protein UA08_02417 [Talaromyces atroroseus]
MVEVVQKLCEDMMLSLRKVEVDIKKNINDLLLEHRHLERDHVRGSILDWITPFEYSRQQNETISKRQPGTCQWFLDSLEFQKWIKSDGQTLFCPGIPGAGKTVLVSVVVDSLIALFRSDETIGIAYVYCDFRKTHEQTAKDILASLLRQLAYGQSYLPASVISLHDMHRAQGSLPSFEELLTTFRSVAALFSKIFVVIDAIDEMSMACRYKLIPEILDQQYKVNIFVTSRYIPDIVQEFKGSTALEIRASNPDVESYIETHIKSLPCFDDWSPKLHEEVKTHISTAVDGMFLLAHIYLKSIEDKITNKAVRRAMIQFKAPKLPPSESKKCELFDEIYNQTMERVNGQKAGFREFAVKILS